MKKTLRPLNAPYANPFADLVGLSGLSDPLPALLVDDLPGIRSELIPKLRGSETAGEMWARVQRSTWTTMAETVRAALDGRLVFDRVLATTDVLQERATAVDEVIPSSTRWECWEVHVPASKWVVLQLHSATVYSLTDATAAVKLWDMADGRELFSGEIVVEGGTGQLSIKKEIALDREAHLLIGVDCSALRLVAFSSSAWCDYYTRTVIHPAHPSSGWKSAGCEFEVFPSRLDAAKLPRQGNTEVIANGLTGFEIDVQLVGSLEAFITEHANDLKLAYQMLAAARILDEKLASPSLSHWVKTNLEFTQETRDSLKQQFQASINRTVKALKPGGQSLCWACDDEAFSININSGV